MKNTAHPDWCRISRCHVGVLAARGEHRSEPLPVGAGSAGGRIVATRVMTAAGRHWLEMTVVAPLAGPTEPARMITARRILGGLVTALNRAIGSR